MSYNTSVFNSHVHPLENIDQQFGFSQIRRKITNVTLTTLTPMYHIVVSSKLNVLNSGEIKTTFSDQYLIYCSRKC